ncbi:MAG TPA: hypothetical protein VFI41_04840 [Gemmatimonadales bacterium]|nr:hypothetical protein [Gemmatimonadales bacterium]
MKNERGLAALYPKADLHNPHQFEQVVQNIRNVYNASPEQVRQAGRQWYPRVHEAVAKGVKGMGLGQHAQLAGAGLVAALSPGMDFERSNIQAFHELRHVRQKDWDVIMKHGATGSGQKRHPAVSQVLQGLEIGKAPDVQLLKAHRILRGEHPEDVIIRQGSPKTHSFMHNINDPTSNRFVTIDGRAHDIGVNRLTPWTYSGRGISSAALKSGAPTRYEHFQDAYRTAAHLEDEGLGLSMQAITWEGGKHLERAMSGTSKGPRRRGQPYT